MDVSVEYCEACDKNIDTDFDVTHQQDAHPGAYFNQWLIDQIAESQPRADKGNWNCTIRCSVLKEVLEKAIDLAIEDYDR